eukprot:TRINITY_DN3942_c0_g2_i1.p1 TRINITY_DN3942_c0_g2~~TRINITY_DN3942_c0_g2_i1.p1  ORF type:complete len:468 (+),score=92.73 TRINITY_DN3942_c0_g2_i1:173-1576(+)
MSMHKQKMMIHKIETNGLRTLFQSTKNKPLHFTQFSAHFSTSAQKASPSKPKNTIANINTNPTDTRVSRDVNRTISFQQKRLLLPDIEQIDLVSPKVTQPQTFPSVSNHTPKLIPNYIPSVVRTYRFRINSLCETTDDVYNIIDEAERNFCASPEVLAEAIKKLFYISKDIEQSLLLFSEYRFLKKDPTLLYVSLVQLYVDNSDMEKAEEVVKEMQRQRLRVPLAVFESLMYGYCKSPSTLEKANEILFKRLASIGLYPSLSIYGALTYLYSKMPRPEMVKELLSIMGFVPPTLAAGLAVQLSKNGRFDDAKILLPILRNSIEEDILTANIFVYIEEIIQAKSEEPSPHTLKKLDKAIEDAERVYKFIIANEIDDKKASVLMLRGYLELCRVSDIEYMLDLMTEPSELFSYKLLHSVDILGKPKIKELVTFMEKKEKPLRISEWWMIEKLLLVWGDDSLPIEVDLES